MIHMGKFVVGHGKSKEMMGIIGVVACDALTLHTNTVAFQRGGAGGRGERGGSRAKNLQSWLSLWKGS